MFVPGKMGLNYYICIGEDPKPYSYLGGKVRRIEIFFREIIIILYCIE